MFTYNLAHSILTFRKERMSHLDLYAYREKVRTALRKKAVELSLDTHKADIVMGVGREIKILNELIQNKLSEKDYQEFLTVDMNNL